MLKNVKVALYNGMERNGSVQSLECTIGLINGYHLLKNIFLNPYNN